RVGQRGRRQGRRRCSPGQRDPRRPVRRRDEELGGELQPVAPTALSDLLDRLCSVQLGQEGGDGVLASDPVSLVADEVEPLAVVNFGRVAVVVTKNPYGNSLESLTTEAAIEIV